jgi:DNA-binding beta-propeller fold protein YncE
MIGIRPVLFAAFLIACSASHAADTGPAYKIVARIPLGAPDRWDFLFFDGSSDRVYVSHATEVTVVDVAKKQVIGRISGLNTSHGIVTVPELGRGYADSGNTRSVIVFDLGTLKTVATLAAGEDADAMAYDPKTRRVFVMDADGAAFTAIDAAGNKTLSTVPLGGKPESAVGDGAGHIYINIASTGELVRVNAVTLAVETRWRLEGCDSPHGLSMDTVTHRLFVSCENAVMQVVSSDTGGIVATLPIGKGTDADAFDAKRKLAFSSNGDGTLSIIAEKTADTFVALPSVPTMPRARTMTLDPVSGRVFFVSGDVSSMRPASRPGRPPEPVFVPGSLKLFVLEPSNQ